MEGGSARTELRPVPGPSAVGGGRQRFLDLLYLVSVTEFKKAYFGTVLGYFWSLIRPLMLFAVLLFVFTQIFRVGSQVPHYPVLLLFNVVMFTFFQEATRGLGHLRGRARRASCGRRSSRASSSPSPWCSPGLFNFALNLVAVFIFILAFGVRPYWTWLLLPVLVLVLTALTTAVAMLLSSLYVRFRDVQIIWTVLVTMLFYATPILYPLQDPPVPDRFHDLLLLNPLTPLFVRGPASGSSTRAPRAPSRPRAAGAHLAPSIAIFIAICGCAVMVLQPGGPAHRRGALGKRVSGARE